MPTRLVAVTSDLFLQSRFHELARSMKIEAEILPTITDNMQLSSTGPTVVVLDLASSDYDPFTIAKHLRLRSSDATLFGYYPHVRSDLKRRAEEAGFDHIVINRELIPKLSILLAGATG